MFYVVVIAARIVPWAARFALTKIYLVVRMSSSRNLRSRAVMFDEIETGKKTVLRAFSHLEKGSCKAPDFNSVTSDSKNLTNYKVPKKHKLALKLRYMKDVDTIESSSPNKMRQSKNKTQKYISSEKKGNFKNHEALKVIKLAPDDKENKIAVKSYPKINKVTNTKLKGVVKNKRKIACSENSKGTSEIYVATYCPVWRMNRNSSCITQEENEACKNDIYDIDHDKEIMIEKGKKQINSNHLKKRTSKKVVGNKNCKKIIPKPPSRKVVHNNVPLKNDENLHGNCEVIPEETRDNLKNTDVIPCTSIKTDKTQHKLDLNVGSCMLNTKYNKENINIQSEHNKGRAFLLEFAEDFEKSFTFPNMTSTPDNSNLASGDLNFPLKNNLISEISSISQVKPHFHATTSLAQSSNREISLAHLPEQSLNENDITLFESPSKNQPNSPCKKDIPKISSPIRAMNISLFEENLSLSPVKVNLKKTVLKSKKGYHTPEQFRRYLSKSVKTADMAKKKMKTKEDRLCEELNKQFEDISSFELCIE